MNNDVRLSVLAELDSWSEGVPFTQPSACHLLFELTTFFPKAQVVEVACAYGKATLYLAAAAKAGDGHLRCVDAETPAWQGRTAEDLVRCAGLADACSICFNTDARWYLLDLFRDMPGRWIDLAFIDASHTVEVDAFVTLALWTHLRPGGLLVFDDLDWVPAVHGPPDMEFSRPSVSHVRTLFEYVSRLPGADEAAEWGRNELGWSYGLVRRRGRGVNSGTGVRSLLAKTSAGRDESHDC